jgi:hypothetical protein
MKLPPYIYQLIDHIYISDSRSIVYTSQFGLVIHCSYINEPSTILTKQMGKTTVIHLNKYANQPSSSIINKDILRSAIIHATSINQPVLLYSDPYDDSCTLFFNYLMEHYRFTKEDIYRMIISRPMNDDLKKTMQEKLMKIDKNE